MNYKSYNLENNKKVEVFDNLFPYDWRLSTYIFCRNSAFRIGWSDTAIAERTQYNLLFSTYTNEDIINLGIYNYINKQEILNSLAGLGLSKCILNLSVPSDVNFVHTHDEKKVVLYYVNVDWKDGWHGETLFYSENLNDIQLGLPYTPGRLIIFDADIPHTIRPQSIIASHHRMTLAMFYDKQLS